MADSDEKQTPEAPEDETTPDAGATGAQDEAVAADDATASGADSSPGDAPAEAEAAAEPEAAAEQAPAEEPAAEPEPAAEEPPAEAEPADSEGTSDSKAVAPSEETAESPDAGGRVADEAGEPAEAATPKERRQRQRAAKVAQQPARPQRSPEERQAERDAERKRKAQIRSAGRVRARERTKAKRDGAAAGPLQARREKHPGRQKTRQGIVVSDGASKTIVVKINVTRRHPFYEKVVRTSTTLHAHDEREDAHVGDTVVVRESRPLSRTKRWRLVEVLERAK